MERLYIIVAFLLVMSGKATCQKNSGFQELYAGLPFPMEKVKQPEFPGNSVNIVEFGAVGNGIVSNTKAIANAIDVVVKKGGGTVVFPEGTWLTGPIVLKSNVRIHTLKGALVVFSKDKNEYPLVKTWYEGLQSWRCMAPLFAENAENIAITGEGIFDGSGEAWRPVKKFLMTPGEWDEVVAGGGALTADGSQWYPDSSAYRGSLLGSPRGEMDELQAKTIKTFLRPVMLNFMNCKRVLLEGITFQNTPSWCLHPVLCQDITINKVKVFNEHWVVNGDALDLESCKNAIINDCLFDAGDDAICMKSGRDAEGRKRGIPTENVIISKCTVYRGHGAFVIGSEMSGGARNIRISHCTFMGTDNGLRFKSTRGRGGVVENIFISDINMINIIDDAILFDLYYAVKQKTSVVPPVDETTPQFRNIHVKNVVCKGAKRAFLLQGLPEMNLRNITFEDITIEAATGMFCNDADAISFKNLTISTPSAPVIRIEDAKNISFDNLRFFTTSNEAIVVEGPKTENIRISGKDVSVSSVKIAPSVSHSQIQLLTK
ncbi:MAG TPA: glycoside hydrolase family 28 protein [Bacteroidales bacterium]|nr:glycoside hydrolase family 28 protein [Bacteroidales bacterium]